MDKLLRGASEGAPRKSYSTRRQRLLDGRGAQRDFGFRRRPFRHGAWLDGIYWTHDRERFGFSTVPAKRECGVRNGEAGSRRPSFARTIHNEVKKRRR